MLTPNTCTVDHTSKDIRDHSAVLSDDCVVKSVSPSAFAIDDSELELSTSMLDPGHDIDSAFFDSGERI